MGKGHLRSVIGEHRHDVVQLGAVGHRVVVHAHRVLHERVRSDDEERGDVDPDRDDPDAGQVHQPGKPAPAEDPQPDESGFEEERGRPSIASGAPKMSPTNREYSLQFIPNWNSCTIPVATPMAKLIRNNLPKNLVSRYQATLSVATHAVCMMAIRGPGRW